jgi:GT2 family glycosyltransferase
VAVVILNWNTWRDTISAVQSVRASRGPAPHVVVVDNGSGDGSEGQLRAWDPGLHIVQTGANLGWSGGNNRGILAAQAAGCNQVLLLNSDARLRPDTLEVLLRALQDHPEAACAGALVVDASDTDRIEFGGARINPRTEMPRPLHGRRAAIELPVQPVACAMVKGCAMLLGAAGLARVGLLAEDYFLNFDDTDWCFRARALGLDCLLVPQAVVEHQGAVSFGGTGGPLYRYFVTRNALLFARRHLGLRGRFYAWRGVFWELRQALAGTATGVPPEAGAGQRARVATAVLWAALDGLRRHTGDCPAMVRRWNAAR